MSARAGEVPTTRVEGHQVTVYLREGDQEEVDTVGSTRSPPASGPHNHPAPRWPDHRRDHE